MVDESGKESDYSPENKAKYIAESYVAVSTLFDKIAYDWRIHNPRWTIGSDSHSSEDGSEIRIGKAGKNYFVAIRTKDHEDRYEVSPVRLYFSRVEPSFEHRKHKVKKKIFVRDAPFPFGRGTLDQAKNIHDELKKITTEVSRVFLRN